MLPKSMDSKNTCCDLNTFCGKKLWQGVFFVGIATLVISLVIFVSSTVYMSHVLTGAWSFNTQPVVAMNLIFMLVTTSLSLYQILISLMLLWQAFQIKSNIFVLSLWYVSHLSILTLYCALFSSRVVVCFNEGHYITAVVTTFVGVVYQALFAYFATIVNRYINSLDQERYL